jgi:DNA polymerase-3 subunit epsilon
LRVGKSEPNFVYFIFAEKYVDIDLKKRKFIDVMVIFYKKEQRTLSAAYDFYCRKNLENAHSSEADTRATYEILQSQIEKYPDLVNDVDFLSHFSAQTADVDYAGRIVYNDKGEETFNFGRYKGQTVASVFRKDAGYYSWMMQGDFPLYTKKVITEIKLREKFK